MAQFANWQWQKRLCATNLVSLHAHCFHSLCAWETGVGKPKAPLRGGGLTQEGGKRKSKQKWEQNYGSEYISKGSLGLHSAEGFHGVFKSWHGAVLQGLYRFRREMHCLDLHNHVDTSLSK